MTEISLRAAVVEDAEAIARIHVASWQVAYRGLLSDDDLDGRSVHGRTVQWREWLRLGMETLVAADGEALVGFCALRRDPAELVEIGALYLDPGRFREGIGTQLMDATLASLRAAGEPEVTLWVLAGNSAARAFYARHGFTETGESDVWHGAPELRMRLVLTS